jgi:hypothetical protein
MRAIGISAGLAACLTAMLAAAAAQGQIRPGWQGFAARFDANAPIVLTGDVAGVDWAHGVGPKVFVTLSSTDGAGAPANWTIEGGFTDAMQGSGFSTENLKPGVRVSVRGYLAKDGSRVVDLREMTFSDGRKLLVRSSPSVAAPTGR